MVKKFFDKNKDNFYLMFRLLVGVMFLFHGAQKFGWVGGGEMVPIMSLMGLAAIIEFFGGLLITFGTYTRTVSIITGLEMLYVFFMVHTPSSLYFIHNRGELSLLYLAAFCILATQGGGKKWVLKEG